MARLRTAAWIGSLGRIAAARFHQVAMLGLFAASGLLLILSSDRSLASIMLVSVVASAGWLLGVVDTPAALIASASAFLALETGFQALDFFKIPLGTLAGLVLVFAAFQRNGSSFLSKTRIFSCSLLVVVALWIFASTRSSISAQTALVVVVFAGAILSGLESSWLLRPGSLLLSLTIPLVLIDWREEAFQVGGAAFVLLLGGILLLSAHEPKRGDARHR